MEETGRSAADARRGRATGVRWSVRRKADAVMRLLRGEDLDEVSRELLVEAHRMARGLRGHILALGPLGSNRRPSSLRSWRGAVGNDCFNLRSRVGDARRTGLSRCTHLWFTVIRCLHRRTCRLSPNPSILSLAAGRRNPRGRAGAARRLRRAGTGRGGGRPARVRGVPLELGSDCII